MAASKAVAAFNMGIALHPGWTVMNFSVPFNNGSADISMPGFLVTPDASKPLPLMLYTGGTDYPKEVGILFVPPKTHVTTYGGMLALADGLIAIKQPTRFAE